MNDNAQNNGYKILIIDDDEDLSMIISDMLTDYGYRVTHVTDGNGAFDLLSDNAYHLILLDINLPDTDGFSTDRVEGYDIGGDDYLPKPYSMKELLAHVNALIRRTYGFSQQEQVVTFGNVTVNLTARSVVKDGVPVSLSLREFDLLAYLCRHPNAAISKDTLLSEVWGAFSAVEPSTLTVHIRWLREKLEDNPAQPQFIKTVYRVGYLLNA